MHVLAPLINDEIKQRGWSLRTLAKAAGVTQSAISDIINIPERIPRLDTLSGLAHALGLPLSQLVEACGFTVGQPVHGDWRDRAEAIIASVPELRAFFDPVVDLTPEERAAALGYIEGLRQQRQHRTA